ncbi:MAG: NAD(P)H-hydrate dehydratase [Elusimicrobia bacterium]|nr:NAD(P)H-hydrate dehydratase [Elusimicrobiota bacterium]
MKKITPALVRHALPKRKVETQKWDYGHILIIAGSRKLMGAAVLTTKAALRGGAGLVTLATPKSHQMLVYSQVLEALTLPLEETAEGTIDLGAFDAVSSYIKDRGVTAIVVGPGLTRQERTAKFIRKLVKEISLPMVLDADAINVEPDWDAAPLRGSKRPCPPGVGSDFFRCLTPQRREFSRIMGVTEQDVIDHGVELAAKFAKAHPKSVLVLKGHRTKVFYGKDVWENPTGNPGMAKGGSGDVLAGLVGSFIAQAKGDVAQFRSFQAKTEKLSNVPLLAVLAAVYLHGLAGDLAAKALTETAMNAEDIAAFLPQAMKAILRR